MQLVERWVLKMFQQKHVMWFSIMTRIPGVNMVWDFLLDAMHSLDGGLLTDLLWKLIRHIRARSDRVGGLLDRMDAYVTCELACHSIALISFDYED